MSSSRQRGHGKEDSVAWRHKAEQKRQWSRAEYVAGQQFPGGTVTQVGTGGFHVRAPGKIIAEFVSWPSEGIDADERFGRVEGPR